MNNPFAGRAHSLNGPTPDLVPVTPSDSTDLVNYGVAIYIETGGTLSLVTPNGGSRSVQVSDFMVLPVGVRRINATGTTASGLHAFLVG